MPNGAFAFLNVVSVIFQVLLFCVIGTVDVGLAGEAMMLGPAGTESERRRGEGAKWVTKSDVTAEFSKGRVLWTKRGLYFAERLS
jgi:hypothetical protein